MERLDEFRRADGKADALSCHGTGLGESLHHDQIIVLLQQRQNRLAAEVHIRLVYHDQRFRVVPDDLLHSGCRQGNAGGCVGVREHNAAVGLVVVLRHDLQLVVQRLHFIRNAEQVAPYRVKRIGDVREQNGQIAVEKVWKIIANTSSDPTPVNTWDSSTP